MKTTSNFLRVNWQDIIKGFLTAAITVIVLGLSTALSAAPPHFPTMAELQVLSLAGLGAGFAHVVNNCLRNSKDELLTKEAPKEEKVS